MHIKPKTIRIISAVFVLSAILLALVACGSSDTKPYLYSAITKGERVSGVYSQFDGVADNLYLGYGYDAIDGRYMTEKSIKTEYPILDGKKIKNMAASLLKEEAFEYNYYTAPTIEELAEIYSAALKIDKEWLCASLAEDYSGSADEKKFYYFYKATYRLNEFTVNLTDGLDGIREMLSDEFMADLNTMPPALLFEKYGTHLVREIRFGKKIEVSVTYSSDEVGYTTEALAAIGAHVDYLNELFEGSAEYNGECEAQGIDVKIVIKYPGGPELLPDTDGTCSGTLCDYLNSTVGDPSYAYPMEALSSGSLIGIWELTSDENRREEILAYFNSTASAKYGALSENFKSDPNRELSVIYENGTVDGERDSYKKGDVITLIATPKAGYEFDGWYIGSFCVSTNESYTFVVDFDTTLVARFKRAPVQGGGTAEDPYLLRSAEDFDLLREYPNAYYRLVSNVDFGGKAFLPIDVPFGGVLDGNNLIISNVNISISVAKSDTDTYIGLFREISRTGVIYNLHIRNSSVTVSGEGDVFVGFIAGKNCGIIEGCTFSHVNISAPPEGSTVGTVVGVCYGEIRTSTVFDATLTGEVVGEVAGLTDASPVIIR